MIAPNPNSRRRTKAVQLLTRVLAANWFTIDELAEALVVDPRTVGRFISGDIEMPVDRQVCFAHFLIERVPALSRNGHNLLGQIAAAIAFRNHSTTVHNSAPPGQRNF